ncbi:MAG: lipopolysaccharide biosynthesis protein [Hyphomicrobiales bacterium]
MTLLTADTIRSASTMLRGLVNDTGDRAVARRGAIFAFAIRVASAAIAYLAQVMLARWMGAYEYGVFAYVWVWVILLGTLAALGLNTSVLRFIPEYRSRRQHDHVRGFLLGSRVFAASFSTVVALTGAGVLFITDSHWLTSTYVVPIYLALICLPIFTLTDAQEGTARAHSWIDLALLPPYIVRPLLLLVFLGLAVWLGMEATAKTAVLAAIAATWVAGVGQTLLLNRRLAARIEKGPRAYEFALWFKVSIPIFLVEGFYMLLANTDILVMSIYRPPGDIAMYYAAVKTTSLISFVYYSVTAAFAHRFSEYNASGDREGLEQFLRDAVSWTFWPSLAAAAAILSIGWPLLWLFGPEFTAAYPIMFVLVIGLLARAAVGPVDYMLSMLGQQNACAMVLASAAVVNLALNFLMIPTYGLMGAAVATSISTIYATIMLYNVAKRRLGLRSFFWKR